MKTLVSTMALHQAKPIEAVAASTPMPEEETETLINPFARRANRGLNHKCPIHARKAFRNGHSYKQHDKISMPWPMGFLHNNCD